MLQPPAADAPAIEDYAMIGDCETAALVSRNGSIDWLCWPRFDSDACFAALLGTADNGRWLFAPAGEATSIERSYVEDTLVLETRFTTPTGRVRLVDFMPLRDGIDLVRIVVGEAGTVAMHTELVLRFGYGAQVPWMTQPEDGVLQAISGPDLVVLRTPVPLEGRDMRTAGEFTVSAGETLSFVLSYGPSHLPRPAAIDPEAMLRRSVRDWRRWMGRKARPRGPWADAIARSLITLKALTYAPTGGIIAAPTTSLPETPGGVRNWDYRFCWLRDATLTLMALMNSGFYAEARAWRDWLLRALAGDPAKAQIMYGIAGERRLAEWTADWLPGYQGAAPVRIGNAAAGQLQLDVYGEVIDAFYQGMAGGLGLGEADWGVVRALLGELERRWHEPDRGIWESRDEPRHYTFSKVMCWVAFDRAVKLVRDHGLDGPADRWAEVRDAIHADVCGRGYDGVLRSFVADYGSDRLDASLLLIPTTGFLPPSDPRVRGTIAAIEGRLVVDGLVMRHDPALRETGLDQGEGAFLACSFWLADAYTLVGRVDDAKALFERLAGLRNDVGLLAEEYSAGLKRQLGNFPQAFSHVALVNTAHNLSQAIKPARQRAAPRTMAPRADDAAGVPFGRSQRNKPAAADVSLARSDGDGGTSSSPATKRAAETF